MGIPVSEVMAIGAAASAAVRAEEGDLRPGLGLGVALTGLVLVLFPAAIGLAFLLGLVS